MESRAILHDKVQYILEQEIHIDEDRADYILDTLFGPVSTEKFQEELCSILSKYSKDADCNTPDFVLAEYLCQCLDAFKYNLKYRESCEKST